MFEVNVKVLPPKGFASQLICIPPYVKILFNNKPACCPLVPGDVATAEAVVDAVLDLVNMLNSSWGWVSWLPSRQRWRGAAAAWSSPHRRWWFGTTHPGLWPSCSSCLLVAIIRIGLETSWSSSMVALMINSCSWLESDRSQVLSTVERCPRSQSEEQTIYIDILCSQEHL